MKAGDGMGWDVVWQRRSEGPDLEILSEVFGDFGRRAAVPVHGGVHGGWRRVRPQILLVGLNCQRFQVEIFSKKKARPDCCWVM